MSKIYETSIDINQNTNNSKTTISHQLCFEELWNVEDRGKDNDRQDVACHSCYWARWGRVVPDIIVFKLVIFQNENSETISALPIVSSLVNCACCFCIWQSYFCKKDSIWGQNLLPFWYSQWVYGKEISPNGCILKGIVPQKISYRLNLTFWILMGCGIALVRGA